MTKRVTKKDAARAAWVCRKQQLEAACERLGANAARALDPDEAELFNEQLAEWLDTSRAFDFHNGHIFGPLPPEEWLSADALRRPRRG